MLRSQLHLTVKPFERKGFSINDTGHLFVRAITKVLIADAVLLIALFLVLQDLGWRSAYATAKGLSPSFGYSPLIQVFTLGGGSVPLQSPLTLDWVQVIAVLLVAVNASYLFRIFGQNRPGRRNAIETGQGNSSPRQPT